jgi:hypothetical protein
MALMVMLLASAPARAQTTSANARVLFREARKLMEGGRFEQACPMLEESLRLDPGMGTQFNLAHCWEKLGRTASAWGLFLDVASAANAAGQAKREAAARQRANALEPQLIHLTIEVRAALPGLKVRRNDEMVGRAAWGTPLAVDPGPQRIEADAPGRLPWSREISADRAGQTLSVSIPELKREQADPPPVSSDLVGPAGKPSQALDQGASAGMSTARIATASVLAAMGVAGAVGGALYGLKANSETEKAKALCVGGASGTVCNRDQNLPNFDNGVAERNERTKHRDSSNQAALFSYIGWGVGATGLGASLIVLLTAPSESAEEEETVGLRLSPLMGSGLLGTTLSGRF